MSDGKRGKFWVKKEEEGWVKADVNEGGKLKESIQGFKNKLYLDVNADISEKGKGDDVKYMEKKQKYYHELMEKKTVDNAIIAKLATECNIKDAKGCREGRLNKIDLKLLHKVILKESE